MLSQVDLEMFQVRKGNGGKSGSYVRLVVSVTKVEPFQPKMSQIGERPDSEEAQATL